MTVSEYQPLPRNFLRYCIGTLALFSIAVLMGQLLGQDRLIASVTGLKADFLDALRENKTALYVAQAAWSHSLFLVAFVLYVSLYGSTQLVYAVSWVLLTRFGMLQGVVRQHHEVNSKFIE